MAHRTFQKNDGLKRFRCARIPGQLGVLMTSLTLGIIPILSSCVDPYWPDLGDRYEDLLVFEGMITNDPGPYVFLLSRSSSLNNPSFEPLSGCQVTISDNEGNLELLTEVDSGAYSTAADGIRGMIGRMYQVTIQSPQGVTYRSDYEMLNQPAGIDSVYVELEYKAQPGFPMDIPGYQFYVNTKSSGSDTNYFLWDLERTYEYHADFLIFFWYDGTLHIFPDPDSLQVCWSTGPVYELFTASTTGLSEPVLTGFPLHYVPFINREFSVRYSLLVKQYTITQAAQEYWSDVKEQNTSVGEYYSKMPFQVRGNLENTTDPDEPVLGYFHAAGVVTKRLFFNRPGYPAEMYYSTCELSQPDYEEYGWMFKIPDPRDYPRYVTMNTNNVRAVPNPFCIDCRENGGSIVKPDFWIDYDEFIH